MKKTALLILGLIIFGTVFSQSAKTFYKTAKTFEENGKLTDAVENYTKALNIDPEYVKAYVSRGELYARLGDNAKALEDFEKAVILKPKEEDYAKRASEIAYNMANYAVCIKYADKALERNRKMMDVRHLKVLSLYNLEKYDKALAAADEALEIKKNYQTYFDKATVLYAMKKYEEAISNYNLAMGDDHKTKEALLGRGNAYYHLENYDQAISTANEILNIDPKSKDAYWLRATSYGKKLNYVNAINDLSQIIVYHKDEPYIKEVYYERGLMYMEFSQFLNAINDFTTVLEKDPAFYQAHFKRAAAYEKIQNYDAAIKDYETLNRFHLKDAAAVAMLEEAHKRLFELKRETDKPVLVITQPRISEKGRLKITKGAENQKFTGHVEDASAIKYFKINGQKVSFDTTSKNHEFSVTLPVKDLKEITFTVSDVYDNVRNDVYPVLWTEKNPPEFYLIQPMASDDGQIYLDDNSPSLYIEGTVSDESKIANIMIDSVNASYIPNELNPSFNATVKIANKGHITFEITDIYGNKTVRKYLLNRDNAAQAATNPMGKTWVVFIENTDYQTFASLSGPTKDVSMIKAALSKYKINNIIHKRNMTKSQMERFFNIELRDLIVKNHVNSIIIWYAGHGKYLNNTGYWVPVDGKTDDEFTYFNISSLKSALQSYSSVVTHTLVITDACESGPSFYQAMRSDIKIRDCSDWKATKFKSSQVFSSAGYELASDNSQFTKTFANTLIHNPNECIPIESIVLQVKKAVKKNENQEPQFGNIDGLTNEDGTFFFIRK